MAIRGDKMKKDPAGAGLEDEMHLSEYSVTGYGPVYVNHNSDYSGDAIVSWTDSSGDRKQVAIPGNLLLEIGKDAAVTHVRDRVIDALERM